MEDKKEIHLVTAVITTYNRPMSILKRAIESVLKQTYNNIEIIVVNACPENLELEKKIRNYLLELKKVKYLKLEKNSLSNVARNAGLSKANGDFIAFLDDDDQWIENKIELQIQKFVDNKIGLVYGQYYEIGCDYKKIINLSGIEGNIISELLKKNIIGGTSVPLISKKLLEDIGGFDDQLPSSQDYDVWIRICKDYEVSYVDKPLINYYVSDDAITRNMKKRIDGYKILEKKYLQLFLEYKKSYNVFLNNLTRCFIKINDKTNAIIYLKKAIKMNVFSLRNIKTFLYFFKIIK